MDSLQLGTHQSTILQLALMEFAECRREEGTRYSAKQEGEVASELRDLLREASAAKVPILIAETRY